MKKKKIMIKRHGTSDTEEVAVKKRRVGIPTKPIEPIIGLQSITNFFRAKND